MKGLICLLTITAYVIAGMHMVSACTITVGVIGMVSDYYIGILQIINVLTYNNS